MKKIAVAILFMLFVCCSEQPTDPPENGNVEPAAMLTVSDTGLTRLGLRLQLQNARLPVLAALTRANVKDTLDDTLLFRHVLTGNDTAFYDDNLQPNENYLYELWLAKDSTQQQWYRFAFNRRTMDTTGHNFSWQVYEFGGAGGSSYLNDVAIVNENNIWAVGRISVADSAGEIEEYNAVHWDGEKWEMFNFMRTSEDRISVIRGISVENDSSIWLAAGSVYHWKGHIATLFYRRDISTNETVEKLWHSGTGEIYGVGNSGLIVHYDGQSWTKLQSGTDVNLTDVWGTPDGKTVWACGWEDFKGTVLIKINGNTIETLYESEEYFRLRVDTLSGSLVSGAVSNNTNYILTSRGIYTYSLNLPGSYQRAKYPEHHYSGFPRSLSMSAINDIFIVGDLAFMAHYNGASWHEIPFDFDGAFKQIHALRNVVCAVGYDLASPNNNALIFKSN